MEGWNSKHGGLKDHKVMEIGLLLMTSALGKYDEERFKWKGM